MGRHIQKSSKNRRFVAITGLTSIIGIAGTATLGAWTYNEYLNATLKVSAETSFESSTNGTTWTSNPTSPGGSLTFTANSGSMSPGDITYAPLAIRMKAGGNFMTKLKIDNTGTMTGLKYSILNTTTLGCTSSTTGTALITNQALGTNPATPVEINIPASTSSAVGAPAYLCIKIEADSTLPENSSVNNIFKFYNSL